MVGMWYHSAIWYHCVPQSDSRTHYKLRQQITSSIFSHPSRLSERPMDLSMESRNGKWQEKSRSARSILLSPFALNTGINIGRTSGTLRPASRRLGTLISMIYLRILSRDGVISQLRANGCSASIISHCISSRPTRSRPTSLTEPSSLRSNVCPQTRGSNAAAAAAAAAAANAACRAHSAEADDPRGMPPWHACHACQAQGYREYT